MHKNSGNGGIDVSEFIDFKALREKLLEWLRLSLQEAWSSENKSRNPNTKNLKGIESLNDLE